LRKTEKYDKTEQCEKDRIIFKLRKGRTWFLSNVIGGFSHIFTFSLFYQNNSFLPKQNCTTT